ncbi:hypothetical protein [Streptomyces zaomyceticus]|uniref:hypothetical protein n=1 Tax=Streptomyces zaomyceticus TaxID=68286 RepID=UPI0033AAC97F
MNGPSGTGGAAKGSSGSPATAKGPGVAAVPGPRTAAGGGTNGSPAPKSASASSTSHDGATKTDGTGTKDTAKKDSPGAKNEPAQGTDTRRDPAAERAARGPLFTRSSRETGYRDGIRAGRAAAKTRAYGHGVQDGWQAVMDTADDEKTVLDRARDLRKERKDPPVTTMPLIPPPPTSPTAVAPDNPAPAAEPLTVTGIDAATVHLGDDANRASMTRGEVRSLKGFERRLTDHHGQVQTVAEATRGLAFHARQQADSITRLLEQAKGVKGGEKLLATLARLQEAAQAQVVLAEETHRRAVRGADATGAVLANTITRYGAIYQAVVDSDETAPAELSFYEG